MRSPAAARVRRRQFRRDLDATRAYVRAVSTETDDERRERQARETRDRLIP